MRDEKPDALKIPESWKQGGTKYDRLDSILMIAEPILGVEKGQAHLRKQPGNVCFITANPYDTFNYPIGHPKEGQARYDWESHESGMVYGYLKDPSDVAGPLSAEQQDLVVQRGKALLEAERAKARHKMWGGKF